MKWRPRRYNGSRQATACHVELLERSEQMEQNHHHIPRPSWYQHALNLAEAASARSEDPYCKVGAAVLSSWETGNYVLGVGYNGTVRGVNLDWSNRDARRPFVIHAEANALRYTTPIHTQDGLLAVTHFPCAPCVVLAASYGITTVVWSLAPDWERYPYLPVLEVANRLGVVLHQIGEQ